MKNNMEKDPILNFLTKPGIQERFSEEYLRARQIICTKLPVQILTHVEENAWARVIILDYYNTKNLGSLKTFLNSPRLLEALDSEKGDAFVFYSNPFDIALLGKRRFFLYERCARDILVKTIGYRNANLLETSVEFQALCLDLPLTTENSYVLSSIVKAFEGLKAIGGSFEYLLRQLKMNNSINLYRIETLNEVFENYFDNNSMLLFISNFIAKIPQYEKNILQAIDALYLRQGWFVDDVLFEEDLLCKLCHFYEFLMMQPEIERDSFLEILNFVSKKEFFSKLKKAKNYTTLFERLSVIANKKISLEKENQE